MLSVRKIGSLLLAVNRAQTVFIPVSRTGTFVPNAPQKEMVL